MTTDPGAPRRAETPPPGPPSHLPTPRTEHARWPAHRQLVVDGARFGAAAGVALGALLLGRWAWVGLALGAAIGTGLAWVAGPRRYRFVLDERGVSVGRLRGTTRVPWADVVAFGRRSDHHGRGGRMVGLVVCVRGELPPLPVPALTWTASAMRMGRAPARERLEPYAERCLAPVREWAAATGTPVIDGDIDRWWDRHPAAPA